MSETGHYVENLDLDIVRQDYRFLDKLTFTLEADQHILVMEGFTPLDEGMKLVPPPGGPLKKLGLLSHLYYAWRLLRRCGPLDCLLLNGGERPAQLAALLNQVLPGRRRKIVQFGAFVATPSRFKRKLVRLSYLGATYNSVWSVPQIALQAAYLGVPEEKFFVIAYKSNHSKRPAIEVPTEHFVFAGGNSGRDYETLFKAFRGTSIPLMVASTRPDLPEAEARPDNVHVVEVHEPEFGRLMATSRFMVMAIKKDRIRGAGEATLLNAMWQKKAVIVADNLSAADYIKDGETGFVVPAGDVRALRDRVLTLWRNPDRADEMGTKAHASVYGNFQHKHFVERLKKMAMLVARSEV